MCSHRQSGRASGNAASICVKGNRLFGDGRCESGKSNQTLWRKVYSVYHHRTFIYKGVEAIKSDSNKAKKKRRNISVRWALLSFLLTLVLSGVMTYISSTLIEGATFWVALFVLIVIVLIGVFFDMVGVAVTSAQEAPFVAMTSKKVKGAKNSLQVLKHAEKVSNVCNDVVGDICSVVAGTAAAAMAFMVAAPTGFWNAALWGVIISALVSALTVSLKALGKGVAITSNKQIIEITGKVLSIFIKE